MLNDLSGMDHSASVISAASICFAYAVCGFLNVIAGHYHKRRTRGSITSHLLLTALERHAANSVIDNQNENGSCCGYEHAIQIQARTSIRIEEVEQISAGHCANDSQADVQKHALVAPA
jgi:hypothetical protein